MNDLISRKDAILMIQRHGVGCFDQEDFYPEEAERFVISMLEKLPSAEPVIIHCKDCKYGNQDEYGWWFCSNLCCQMGEKDGSGFCSDAERRTDE